VKMVSAKEIEQLKKEFEKIDTDNSGYINAEELFEAMKKSNIKVPITEINRIIEEIDFKGNNQINYSEFIAATLQTKKILNNSRLMIIFKEFDVDNSGYITRDNLMEAFKRLGKDASEKDIDDILIEHDKAGDGQISFEEFKLMMLGEDDIVENCLTTEGHLKGI
jgi:calcium-dependent protein kinase